MDADEFHDAFEDPQELFDEISNGDGGITAADLEDYLANENSNGGSGDGSLLSQVTSEGGLKCFVCVCGDDGCECAEVPCPTDKIAFKVGRL